MPTLAGAGGAAVIAAVIAASGAGPETPAGGLAASGAPAPAKTSPVKAAPTPLHDGSALTADMAIAQEASFEITTTATGDLQAKNQLELRSELEQETTIVELVPEGKFVKTGELIVKLNGDKIQTDIDEQGLQVESAKAELVAAENSFEIQKSENESKVRQATLKVDLAALSLEQWKQGEVVQKRKDIQLSLEKTDRDFTRLKKKLENSEKLFAAKFLSADQFELDKIAVLESKAARDKSLLEQETYEKYQYPKDEKQKVSDVEEARAELARVKAQAEIELTGKDAARINRRHQLTMREERLAKLRKQLTATEVRAPQDGLVVYATSAGRNWFDDSPFVVGRRIQPRETLIVLPDTSEMVAVVKVHESIAGRLKPGQAATVRVDAAAQALLTGKVESIGVMAETQERWRDPNRREFSVRVLLDNIDLSEMALRPSMRCEARIVLGQVDGVLSVPIQAVFNEGPVRFVYAPAPRGGKYVRVPVKVGQRSDTFAQIAAGIDAGRRVLLRQPQAGEVLQTAWDKGQLELAGLTVGPDGNPVAARSAGDGGRGPGGKGGAPAGGRDGPGSKKPGPEAPRTAAADGKPAGAAPSKDAAADATKPADTSTPADPKSEPAATPTAPAAEASTEKTASGDKPAGTTETAAAPALVAPKSGG